MWILRRAHTWQIHPQGREKIYLEPLQKSFIKYPRDQMTLFSEITFKVVDQPWHAKCLSCASCAQPLREKCFVKNRYFQNHNQLSIIMLTHSSDVFCREDFFRKYGTKCAGCQEGIAPSSVVGISGKDWRKFEFEFWRSLFSGAASSRSRLPRRLLPVHSLQQEIGEQCKLHTG